jgi:hypothetical protein
MGYHQLQSDRPGLHAQSGPWTPGPTSGSTPLPYLPDRTVATCVIVVRPNADK